MIAPATHDTGSAVAAVPVPPARRRRTSARARGRSSGSSVAEPLIDDADVRRQPDERGRRRRHVPAAAERDRALAPARVPARVGARGRRLELRRARRAGGARAAAALARRPGRPAPSPRPATCRSGSARSAPRTGQPVPETPGEVVRCVLESLALRHARAVELLARGDGRRAAGDPRRRRRRAERAALPVDGRRGRAARARGAGGGDGDRQPRRAGDRARRARVARGGAARRPRVVRADASTSRADRRRGARRASGSARLAAAPQEARGAVSETTTGLGGIAAPADRWDADAAAGLTGRRRARLPLEPARRRPRAREPGRRQHVAEGRRRVDHAGRETRDALGQGLGHRPRDDHGRRLPGAPARRACCRCASATRWTTPRWSTTSCRCGALAGPAAAVDRDAPARVRPGAARRPHAPGRRDRAHLLPDGRRLAEEEFGDEAVWLDYQRPGFDDVEADRRAARGAPAARAPSCSRSTASSPGARRARSRTARRSSSSRAPAEALARAGDGRFGLGGAKVRRRSRTTRPSACSPPRCPRSAARCSPTPTGVILEVDRSPEAVAFASSVRAPEVSQVGAPCPDHLINTKHKPLVVDFDPETDSADELAERARGPASREYARLVPRLLRAQPDRREPAVPDRPRRPARRPPARASASSRAAATPARRASRASSTSARSRSRTAADAAGGFRSLSEAEAFAIEYWPLERYKLAQLPPPGELSGRIALVTGGASGIGRATARRLAELGAHVAVADLNAEGAEDGRRRAPRRASARGARSALEVDVTSEEAVAEAVRRVVLEYGGLDVLVCSAGIASSAPRHRDDARRLGDELRRARARVLPRRAGGVPRAHRPGRAAARSSSSARRTRSSAARTRRRTRPRRRPRCTSRAASPRRAASTGSASTPSTRTR